MKPKDLHIEQALMIAGAAVAGALFVVKDGPIHVALWLLAIGAIVLATTKFGSEVAGG